ncbi:MAG TPA: hypothetical protein VKV96_20855 [Roseiarcus sp.]|nr:hypothetical protein [Roseiarcus sp.]
MELAFLALPEHNTVPVMFRGASLVKPRLIALVVILGAAGAASAETAPNFVPRSLLLSSTSVYDWNCLFADREDKKVSLLTSRGLDPVVFAIANKSSASASLSRSQRNPAFGPKLGAFGLLPSRPAQTSASAPTAITKRLLKIGAERQLQQSLFGPKGSLSAVNLAKGVADDVTVRGVNDEEESAATPVSDGPTAGESVPIRAPLAAYSDEKSGVPTRTHIVDASEGTPLDPLLNTTYDLNYPKIVPSMRELSREAAASRSNRP